MKSFYFVPNKDSFKLTKKSESIKYKIKSFYFTPNKDSFKLTKKNESTKNKMEGFYFVPNKDSSKLTKKNESIKYKKIKSFYFVPNKDSFRLTKKNESIKKEISGTTQIEEPANNVKDFDKRGFLKVLGMAGLGLAATSLLPKKADALILGGTPTSSVVGVKNVANTRINPATEETLDEVLKKTDLTFDTGSLQVKVTSMPAGNSSFSDSLDVAKSGLVDGDRHVQVDVLSSSLPTSASTETTLQTIAFGGKQYALKMTTVGDVDYIAEADAGTLESANVWRAKKVDSTSGITITWADGDAGFNNVATNLPGLTYS
jgi:hypothetical protein